MAKNIARGDFIYNFLSVRYFSSPLRFGWGESLGGFGELSITEWMPPSPVTRR